MKFLIDAINYTEKKTRLHYELTGIYKQRNRLDKFLEFSPQKQTLYGN